MKLLSFSKNVGAMRNNWEKNHKIISSRELKKANISQTFLLP